MKYKRLLMMSLLMGVVVRPIPLISRSPVAVKERLIIRVGKPVRQPLPRKWERKVRAP